MTRHCSNIACDTTTRRLGSLYEVDPETGLCAGCLWERRTDELEAKTRQLEEGSPEYEAIDAQLDALAVGGPRLIEAELEAARKRQPRRG